MTDDYKEWEIACKKIRKENGELLQEFLDWLMQSGLKEKTAVNHVSNVDFYINEFLLYSDVIEARDGADFIGIFLGDWFIRKAAWASAAQIKSNAASFKKFYTFLLEKGDITAQELAELKQTIKEDMPDWLRDMKRYW